MSDELDQGTGTGGGISVGNKVVELYELTNVAVPAGYEILANRSASLPAILHDYRTPVQEILKPRLLRDPAARDALRRALLAAAQISEQMLMAYNSGELIGLSNAGFQLEEVLGELWKLRKHREDEWGDLLNLLQTALAQEEYERFSELQCKAIQRTIVEYLTAGAVDDDDLARAVKLFRESGLDPWKAISGKNFSSDADD